MRMYKTGEICPLCGQIITTTDPEELLLLSESAAALSPSGPGQMTVREYAAAQGISMQAVYQQIHAGKLNVAMRGDASKPRMYILLDPEEPAPVRQIVPAEPDAVYCSLFTCSLRHGNYCCSSCRVPCRREQQRLPEQPGTLPLHHGRAPAETEEPMSMARKDMIDGETARKVKQMSVPDLNEFIWKIYQKGYTDGIATAVETITTVIKKNTPTS